MELPWSLCWKPCLRILLEAGSTKEADIYFLIDGSGSIQRNDFEDIKTFVNETTRMFQVGANNVRIGVVQYASAPKKEFVIGTRTGDALIYMKSLFQMASRENVPQILVVITDGKSEDEVKQAAGELRQQGITIYAIGIKEAVQQQLEEIAETRVYFVNDFDSLKNIKEGIVQNISSVRMYLHVLLILKMILLHIRNKDLCVGNLVLFCKNVKVDVVFLVDGSESVRSDDFQKVKDFMQSFANNVDVGLDNVRIGLLQFSSKMREEFQLDRYNTADDMGKAIQKMKQIRTGTQTGKALNLAAPYFDRPKGGRPELKQYLIVVTDGESHDSVPFTARALNFARQRFDVNHGGRPSYLAVTRILILITDEPTVPSDKANLPMAIRALKEDEINLIAVGISKADRAELKEITEDQERLYFAQNYDALESIHKNLAQIVCEKSKPGKDTFG
uniref:VWFA domain-containing protein n=1 Tax=Anas platyrhynchos platyrhynchos TaxID=8840 RepID=A0A493ST29_ANAPP